MNEESPIEQTLFQIAKDSYLPGSEDYEFSPLTLDDIATPLNQVTFVVVDLETAGGPANEAGITEIGAVKVRGGEVIGEYRTFTNPGVPIPPFISALTGITQFHVSDAPTVSQGVSAFLDFAGFGDSDGPVLVAHNAPFDVGFLISACKKYDLTWNKPRILDTVTIARKVLRNGEVINNKLGTLAKYFHAQTKPTHRALDDARATVTVLHGLIERLGNLGISDLDALSKFDGVATEKRRLKRHLADALPESPGVYIFYDVKRFPLYVGTSTNIKRRVKTYFTASESRRQINSMIALAESVEAIVCANQLEASIRELRLIAELKPRYNIRSRKPESTAWVRITDERFPRLSIIRKGHTSEKSDRIIGPFHGQQQAELAMSAIYEVLPIRQCKEKISKTTSITPCVLAEINRCVAPCVDGSDNGDYLELISELETLMTQNHAELVNNLTPRMESLAKSERYEDASIIRDRLNAFRLGSHRAAAVRSLRVIPEMVAVSNTPEGGWQINVIKRGRLAASAHALPGQDAQSLAKATLLTSAADIDQETLVGETEILLRWLGDGHTRIVEISPGCTWSMPVGVGLPIGMVRG